MRKKDSGVSCYRSVQFLEKSHWVVYSKGNGIWTAADMDSLYCYKRYGALNDDPLTCLCSDKKTANVNRDKRDTLGKVAFLNSLTDR